ncbi:hypothetical protein BGZ61DRAFT_93482 [Ilyonectria robusta]|uniref:uncharacterized protein n=1 Tax=Ilyonectria robusta TaxID=1079257 RepID=UPI001E8CA9B2|nr:uncharacterized protein BGZ61DRAFT_93482 [Ilyonectria robusta]KAH8736361.1 hypothetical protein BGZ61DRAFT_93482 [Ilyonectria robusta]
MESPPASGRGRRASNACERCRRRKIRCTGSHPCTNCSRKNLSCHFDGQGRKVVVSQKSSREQRLAQVTRMIVLESHPKLLQRRYHSPPAMMMTPH